MFQGRGFGNSAAANSRSLEHGNPNRYLSEHTAERQRTHCHRPNERNKVQAFNDFLVCGSMAIGSFSSGTLLVNFGWSMVNGVVFPVALAATALLVWGALRGRRQSA